MLYSILIYVPEDLVDAMSEAEIDEHIERHMKIHDQLRAQDRLGPVVRLMPTTTAVQLRTSSTPTEPTTTDAVVDFPTPWVPPEVRRPM